MSGDLSSLETIIMLGVIALGVIVVLVFVIAMRDTIGMLLTGKRQNQARAHGESAQAVILQAWQTGHAVGDETNANPELGLLLQVQPLNRPSFQIQAATFVPVWDMPRWQPGAHVEIKYDPRDTSKVAVERLVG